VQPYRSSGFQHLASKTPIRRLIRTSLNNNTHKKIVSRVAAAATGPVDRASGADITSSVAIRPEEGRKCYPLSYCIAVHITHKTRHGRNEQKKKKSHNLCKILRSLFFSPILLGTVHQYLRCVLNHWSFLLLLDNARFAAARKLCRKKKKRFKIRSLPILV